MWCRGAQRYISQMHASARGDYAPCMLFEQVYVGHDDARTIAQKSVDFWCGSRWVL